MPIDALIFVPLTDPHSSHWVTVCYSYCLRHGYAPLAVVHRWTDVLKLVFEGTRAVIVVGRRDHLDPKRMPRVEVVCEEQPGVDDNQRRASRRWEGRRPPPGSGRR